MTASVYFEQSELWGNQPEPYQVQVMADILDLLPSDVTSVLDAGCGDGLITNALPLHLRVVGLDQSPQALQHVRRETRCGLISDMPFPDQSFDLVMTTDVLEHLPAEVLQKAIRELTRVARKYVLICVPHQEQWKANFTRCSSCGHSYHINHHQKSWCEQDLVEGLMPGGWNVHEVRYSGLFRPQNDPTVELRHKLGLWHDWPGAVCPNCDSKNQIHLQPDQTRVNTCLECLSASEWWAKGSIGYSFRDRSEIMALYSCQGRPLRLYQPLEPATVRDSRYALDFRNVLQSVNGWTISPLWPCYQSNPCQVLGSEGLRILKKYRDANELPIRFPVQPAPGDEIVLNIRVEDIEADVSLIVYDALTERRIPLEDLELPRGDHQRHIKLGESLRDCYSDRFGFLLIVSTTGNVVMRRVEYLPANEQLRQEVPWLYLAPGHQVYSRRMNGYLRSWGFTSLEGGRLPLPRDLAESSASDLIENETHDDLRISLREARTRMEKMRADHLLFEIEQHFSTQTKMTTPKDESIDTRASAVANLRLVENYHSILTHQGQRILIISHMYPHTTQPGLGPFIHEQVSALRVNSGLDARVICCTPFWFNTFNPAKVTRAYAAYRRLLAQPRWQNRDGVPVLYLPYMVGGFFRHWLHAVTYCNAVMAISDWLRQDFEFELIHAHTSYLDGTAALALQRKFDVPYLITEHTGPFSLLTKNKIIRDRTVQALTHASQILCVSSSLATQVGAILPDSEQAKIEVLHNGVDTSLFNTSMLTQANPATPRFLSVISLDENKNPFLLLDAFQKMHQQLPGARLDIVGQGPLYESVAQSIQNRGLSAAVTLLGYRSRSEVAQLMRDCCDALVLSSNSETFGVVLIEALASGKPIVSTDCGGPRDIVTDPEVGILCPVGDPQALADAMRQIASRLSTFRPESIRRFAIEHFDYFNLASRLAQVYSRVIR